MNHHEQTARTSKRISHKQRTTVAKCCIRGYEVEICDAEGDKVMGRTCNCLANAKDSQPGNLRHASKPGTQKEHAALLQVPCDLNRLAGRLGVQQNGEASHGPHSNVTKWYPLGTLASPAQVSTLSPRELEALNFGESLPNWMLLYDLGWSPMQWHHVSTPLTRGLNCRAHQRWQLRQAFMQSFVICFLLSSSWSPCLFAHTRFSLALSLKPWAAWKAQLWFNPRHFSLWYSAKSALLGHQSRLRNRSWHPSLAARVQTQTECWGSAEHVVGLGGWRNLRRQIQMGSGTWRGGHVFHQP